ncbi:DUF397 domain-containing protein [Plantactinospora solaniradicis]|uniref:DUF397 domain-containing protein n=1 Tax=Plantactinospora solaniradicis TaxID=1723736 RepID=A0ABW1K1G4_9ACTN
MFAAGEGNQSVASDRTGLNQSAWRRSSRCVTEHHCVEVASATDVIALRNSRHPADVLLLPGSVWRNLISGVKAGVFERSAAARG